VGNETVEVAPTTSNSDTPIINIQSSISSTPNRLTKTGKKSTEKSLEKFAELCNQNAQQRQEAATVRQEQFISDLFDRQRQFEQDLKTQFFQQQNQLMQQTTASLLNGLRGLSFSTSVYAISTKFK
jgi:hypothetical protein